MKNNIYFKGNLYDFFKYHKVVKLEDLQRKVNTLYSDTFKIKFILNEGDEKYKKDISDEEAFKVIQYIKQESDTHNFAKNFTCFFEDGVILVEER